MQGAGRGHGRASRWWPRTTGISNGSINVQRTGDGEDATRDARLRLGNRLPSPDRFEKMLAELAEFMPPDEALEQLYRSTTARRPHDPARNSSDIPAVFTRPRQSPPRTGRRPTEGALRPRRETPVSDAIRPSWGNARPMLPHRASDRRKRARPKPACYHARNRG